MDNILKFLNDNKIGKIKQNVSISTLTTYRTGGIAKYVIYPKNIDKLIILIRYLKNHKIMFKIIGNGSNLLFSDNIYNGVLIKLDNFDKITFNKYTIHVGAGYNLIKLAMLSAKKSLTGLEFASGIPGTVGGSIYMNAGAYKSDMGYVVKSIKVLTPSYEVITMTNKELKFHYRTSFLKTHPNYICLEATFKLTRGKKSSIEQVIIDRRKRRFESQPLDYPSAGSVYRNPEGMYAGKLIEDLGLKGLYKGKAQISKKHANFIINKGGATSQDIKDLMDLIENTVKEKYNISLQKEQELVNWE